MVHVVTTNFLKSRYGKTVHYMTINPVVTVQSTDNLATKDLGKAVRQLQKEAYGVGANAIIGLHFQFINDSAINGLKVIASGTAIRTFD